MFQFIKLVQPVWYFNLPPGHDHGYFPAPDVLRKQMPFMKPDPSFSTGAADMELSYRAFRLGCINTDSKPGINWWLGQKTELEDEYRFIRKYFHFSRVLFALFYRIITLNNPLKEIKAFHRSKKIKRFNHREVYNEHNEYIEFKSKLLSEAPQVTVIIPTLNRYEYLKDVLADLTKQDYPNFNVIVVDQSTPYRAEFYAGFKLDMKVIHQAEKALWRARNTAIRNTDADYLLFYDDDSRIETDWISQHIKCIDYFKSDISSGVSISKVGASVPENYRYFRWSDQLDTGNVMIHRSVFHKTGLFDRQFEGKRMGDGEFGLRSYLQGFRNVSNPKAQRLHLKVGGGGLREMGSWDAFRPKSIFAPRPVPSVLYLYRKYHGRRAACNAIALNLPPSVIPYKFKNNRKLLVLGSFLTIFLLPFIIIQVGRSWRIASRMLKKSGIEYL